MYSGYHRWTYEDIKKRYTEISGVEICSYVTDAEAKVIGNR